MSSQRPRPAFRLICQSLGGKVPALFSRAKSCRAEFRNDKKGRQWVQTMVVWRRSLVINKIDNYSKMKAERDELRGQVRAIRAVIDRFESRKDT